MNYQRLLLGGAVLIAILSFEIQTVSGQRSLTAVGGNPYAAPSSQGSNPPVVVVRGGQATAPAPTPSNETSAPSNPFAARESSNSGDSHGRWYLEQKKAPNPVKTFRVSHVGADKTTLLEVFALIKEFEERDGIDRRSRARALRIVQRISSTEFMVYRMRSSGYPDYSQRFLLKTLRPINAADGETINMVVHETSDILSYTTVHGAQSSIRVLQEGAEAIIPKKEFTQEEFVHRLRNGETWTLKNFEEEDCRVCFGRGELSAFQGGGRCPQCGDTAHRGKGFIDYRIRW